MSVRDVSERPCKDYIPHKLTPSCINVKNTREQKEAVIGPNS